MCKFVQNRIVVAAAIQNLDVYLLSRSFSTESADSGRWPRVDQDAGALIMIDWFY
jgi:hypothetical protein